MRSRSFARATHRFSASSICSFARRSCHGACGRERSCHPRGSWARLGCVALRRVAAYEQRGGGRALFFFFFFFFFFLAEGYTSGRHGSGTYISPDLPEPIEGNPQRRKKPAAAATSKAVPMQPLGDFVDVTVQSDQRPFNLGRTLIDDRTLELWRKLSARTFRSLDASHFDIPTRAERSSFERPSAIICRPPGR